jgi:lipoprotein-anchoring transpeptidase ErfK/SrfK
MLLVIVSLLGLIIPFSVKAGNCTESMQCITGLSDIQIRQLSNDMQAHPAPEVNPLLVDNAINIHYPGASTFTGVTFDTPLQYPMIWVLNATIPSAYPGATPDSNGTAIPRYTRLNIFYEMAVGDQIWYLVGSNEWLLADNVARLRLAVRPEGLTGRWIAVDLDQQIVTAYDDDQLEFATLISSGMALFPTNEGLFRIWARYDAANMTGGEGAYAYDLDAVPWVMYFDDSIALHGAYWHDEFGTPRSHGCVNLTITDAHWLYTWTAAEDSNAWVYVWNSAEQPFTNSIVKVTVS